MTLTTILAALAFVFTGGLIALIPVKYIIGPELRALTDGARLDAQKARTMAATTHQGLIKVEQRVEQIETRLVLVEGRPQIGGPTPA